MINTEVKRKRLNIIAVLLVLCIILSGCSVYRNENLNGSQTKAVRYILHVGLNDKDTYKQKINDEKAMQIVTDITLKYTGGCTIYKCEGLYKDTKGKATKENSLVIEIYGADSKEIKNIMDELLVSLNQESILVEKGDVTYELYSGKGD